MGYNADISCDAPDDQSSPKMTDKALKKYRARFLCAAFSSASLSGAAAWFGAFGFRLSEKLKIAPEYWSGGRMTGQRVRLSGLGTGELRRESI